MRQITYLDLFCGAGGLSLGFSQAGWACVGAADNWADAVATYRKNFASHPIWDLDLGHERRQRLSKLISNRPDWIIGGPPCQGFSTVGKRERSDPRNQLVRSFHEIVKFLQPDGFLIENVLGFRDMDFVDEISELFKPVGYTVSSVILAAADFGVPQLRRRIFLVGEKRGCSFLGPIPTHGRSSYVTVWDAIGDLPKLAPGQSKMAYEQEPFTKYQRAMRRGSRELQGHQASAHPPHLVRAISHIPDGGNRRDIPSHFQPKSGYHNSYSRLHSGSPAVAVTQNMGKPSGTRCIHPTQDRGLTAREGARLQGFPDSFHFAGGVTSQRLQVANAVSPILAQKVASALAEPSRWWRGETRHTGRKPYNMNLFVNLSG